jgi:XTP/dITP diphosphohydrolase
MMEIVLATRNKKKVDEIRRITAGMEVSIFTLEDFPGCPEVIEDGTTFEENAIKKALVIAKCTNKPALADDSGLEVYSLKGSPGILSARYAGENATDRENTEKLLKEMNSAQDRQGRFVCCIAVAFPGRGADVFCGYSEGAIGMEPKGLNGFGYDPVFYPEGYDKTFAEMSDREKDSLSHRGRALEKFRQYLSKKLKKESKNIK